MDMATYVAPCSGKLGEMGWLVGLGWLGEIGWLVGLGWVGGMGGKPDGKRWSGWPHMHITTYMS